MTDATSRRATGVLILGTVFLVVPVAANLIIPVADGVPGLVITVGLLVLAFIVWPVRAIAVFAVCMVAIGSLQPLVGSRITLLDEIFIPIAVIVTVGMRWRAIRSRTHVVRDISVVVLAGAGVVSSVVHGVPVTIWVPGLSLLLKGLAVFYVVRMWDVTSADVRWILRCYLALATAALVVGLVEFVVAVVAGNAVVAGDFEATRGGIPVVASVFYHPQLFGWMCATAAVFLIAHHVVYGSRWMLLLALVFSVGTILSGRRKSMVGMVGALLTGAGLFVIRSSDVRMAVRRWIPSGIGVAIVTVAFLPVISGLYALTVQGYVDPVITGDPWGPSAIAAEDPPARVALYQASVRIAGDEFPLGVGLGRYGSWISRVHYSEVYRQYGLDRIYGLSPANPMFINDTFWPQILGETGVIGLLAYVAFISWMGLTLVGLGRRRDLPPAATAVVLGTAMMFVQMLIESLVSTSLGSPSQVYVMMLAVGGTMSWIAVLDRDSEAQERGASMATP